jgi:D-alanyl-D-alanine carboxypeptidase/D-alanyl-D-alanine-endopeptidase (penicillin-binding protein 4)
VAYNPSVSGLNLNFNRVHFEWRRSGNGYAVSMDARSDKYRPEVRVARMAVADRSGPVYTYRDGGDHDSWTVARAALGNAGSRWLPVRRPEAYTAEVFASFARSHGIVLNYAGAAGSAPRGTVLAAHKSEPLRDVLRDMLKFSNNLTAEIVGMTASARRLGRPVPLATSAREMSQWARGKLGMQDAKLVDHSGLGEASRLSAEAMAMALARVHRAGALKPILKDFPMRDGNGKVNRSHPISVAAKTGTLYFVSSLAGYATGPDGTEMAFAIFSANPQLRARVDSARDERPEGSASWNGRAKQLQQRLIERWGTVYGS